MRQSGVWGVFGAVLVVLTAALLLVGKQGPGSVVIPLVIVVTAVVMTAWTVVRARQQRIQYEARLTSWAAEQATHHERLRIASFRNHCDKDKLTLHDKVRRVRLNGTRAQRSKSAHLQQAL